MSGQAEPNPALCLANREGYLARSELGAVSRKKNFPKINCFLFHIQWPSFFGQDGWILAMSGYLVVNGPRLRLGPYKQAKMELGQLLVFT